MADWVDVTTAISTAAAAATAATSVIVASRIARQEREHQRRLERFTALVGLLEAFEEAEELAPQKFPGHDVPSDQYKQAFGRFEARLRASQEPLAIARGTVFGHIPFGADDPGERAILDSAREEGDLEQDDPQTLTIRGEIMDAVDEARQALHDHERRQARSIWRRLGRRP